MGRGKGRRNNSGRGRGNTDSSTPKNSGDSAGGTATRTKLTDYIYHIGSAKQAGDFVTVNDYLVRYIKMNYDNGRDIGTALENLEPFNFETVRP